MKRSLIILCLFFYCAGARAQSISLLELVNLTSLTSSQIENYFTSKKLFKLQLGESVNGFVLKHYQTSGKQGKVETIITGTGFKTASGAILYTVSYITGDPQNIINMVDQTQKVNLKLSFQGADPANNIYIYDNFLYHVVIKLNFSQTLGTVDVTQKLVFVQ
ncbi:MAG TPA: hypothetical protein VGC01_03965 [Mucilaginibacter sp.]